MKQSENVSYLVGTLCVLKTLLNSSSFPNDIQHIHIFGRVRRTRRRKVTGIG